MRREQYYHLFCHSQVCIDLGWRWLGSLSQKQLCKTQLIHKQAMSKCLWQSSHSFATVLFPGRCITNTWYSKSLLLFPGRCITNTSRENVSSFPYQSRETPFLASLFPSPPLLYRPNCLVLVQQLIPEQLKVKVMGLNKVWQLQDGPPCQ